MGIELVERRFDDALARLRTAHQLDPHSIMTNWQIANELYNAGQFEPAVVQATQRFDIASSHAWSFRTLGQCLEVVGKKDEAMTADLKAGQIALGNLGRAYVVTGRTAEARKLLEALMKEPFDGTTHNGVAMAFILTAMGEKEQATAWLERTRQDGVRMPFRLEVDPTWEPLHGSPSFNQLKKKQPLT